MSDTSENTAETIAALRKELAAAAASAEAEKQRALKALESELLDDVKEIHKNMEEAEESVGRLTEELESEKSRSQSLEADLAATKQINDSLAEEVKALKSELQQKTTTLDELRVKVDNYENNCTAATAKLEESNASMISLTSRLEQSEKVRQEAVARTAQLETELQSPRSELVGSEEIKKQLQQETAAKEQLQASVDKENAKCKELAAEIAALTAATQNQIEALEADADKKQAELDSVRGEMASEKEKYASLEQSQQQLKEHHDNQLKELASNQDNASAAAVAELSTELDAEKAKSQSAQAMLQEVQMSFATAQAEVVGLKAQLDSADATIAQLRADLEQAHATAAEASANFEVQTADRSKELTRTKTEYSMQLREVEETTAMLRQTIQTAEERVGQEKEWGQQLMVQLSEHQLKLSEMTEKEAAAAAALELLDKEKSSLEETVRARDQAISRLQAELQEQHDLHRKQQELHESEISTTSSNQVADREASARELDSAELRVHELELQLESKRSELADISTSLLQKDSQLLEMKVEISSSAEQLELIAKNRADIVDESAALVHTLNTEIESLKFSIADLQSQLGLSQVTQEQLSLQLAAVQAAENSSDDTSSPDDNEGKVLEDFEMRLGGTSAAGGRTDDDVKSECTQDAGTPVPSSQLAAELQHKERRVQELETTTSELQTKCSKQDEELALLRNELHVQQQRINILSSELDSSANGGLLVDQASGDGDGMMLLVAELRLHLLHLTTDNEKLRQAREASADRVHVLESQIDHIANSFQDELKRLQAAVAELTDRCQRQAQDLEHTTARAGDLESQLSLKLQVEKELLQTKCALEQQLQEL
jgi:chromosome segregation ATPase